MEKSNKNGTIDMSINFLAMFFVIFTMSFGLYSLVIDVIPETTVASSNINSLPAIDEPEKKENLSAPVRIVIAKIGVDQPVANPEKADASLFDKLLLSGVVRYPDSGLLGEMKNMYIFGHSTGLKMVNNQSFRAFNKLGNLEKGDEILVFSPNEVFVYSVTTNEQVSASIGTVEFSSTRTLTLTTCNTFGRKEDRFVVNAEFVRSYKLDQ